MPVSADRMKAVSRQNYSLRPGTLPLLNTLTAGAKKALTTNHDDLNSMPRAFVVEGEN